MLDREITPLGEEHSSERTPFALNEESSSEDTPSSSPFQPRAAAAPVAAPLPAQPSRKRKHRHTSIANPSPSDASKRARNIPPQAPIADPQYAWVHHDVDKHIYEYSTRARVQQFVSVYPVCDDSIVEHVVARPWRVHERVYVKPKPDSYDFTYVYKFLFKEYHISFPLSDFMAGMLNLMNISPSQLHPNSWAFLKCFKLLCHHLGFEPTTDIFTYFY